MSVLVPIILFLVAFPALWCVVLLLSATLGGWSKLAAHYSHDGGFEGQNWSLQSARMGLMGYSAVLRLGADRKSLYMRPMAIFRFAHPALLIPWSDVTVERTRLPFAPYAMSFRRADKVKMRISRKLMRRLAGEGGTINGYDGG